MFKIKHEVCTVNFLVVIEGAAAVVLHILVAENVGIWSPPKAAFMTITISNDQNQSKKFGGDIDNV